MDKCHRIVVSVLEWNMRFTSNKKHSITTIPSSLSWQASILHHYSWQNFCRLSMYLAHMSWVNLLPLVQFLPSAIQGSWFVLFSEKCLHWIPYQFNRIVWTIGRTLPTARQLDTSHFWIIGLPVCCSIKCWRSDVMLPQCIGGESYRATEWPQVICSSNQLNPVSPQSLPPMQSLCWYLCRCLTGKASKQYSPIASFHSPFPMQDCTSVSQTSSFHKHDCVFLDNTVCQTL